jgi:hypothetical protein
MRRFLIVYFSILVVLSLASYVPGLVFAAAIVTVGVGAFALIAANTILLYSAALLPAHIVLRSPLRVPSKIAGFALLLLIPATIARAPGWLSRQLAEQFAREMSLGDYEQPALGRPKSIEIAAGETAARAPPCEDICQRLLFNREVERVRLVRLPFPTAPRGAASSAVAYSIAQQSPCPQVFPRGAQLDKTVRDRIVGGECLIATVDDQSQPDLKLTRTTLYAFDFERPDPRYLPQPEIIPPWPFRSKETRIERLVIEQRGEDAAYHATDRNEARSVGYAILFWIRCAVLRWNPRTKFRTGARPRFHHHDQSDRHGAAFAQQVRLQARRHQAAEPRKNNSVPRTNTNVAHPGDLLGGTAKRHRGRHNRCGSKE